MFTDGACPNNGKGKKARAGIGIHFQDRNGKYEDRFPLKHIVNEQEKVVWILCESAITAVGITAMMKKHYPEYEAKLVNRDSFNDLLKEQ